jgi:hypothetical protein
MFPPLSVFRILLGGNTREFVDAVCISSTSGSIERKLKRTAEHEKTGILLRSA